jgi:predicted HTH domain antitoxin
VEETIMSTSQGAGTFTIELPENLLTPFAGTPEAFAREVRLAAAIEWYREGRVSQGMGAEIAGLRRVDFLDALYRAQVPACQVTVDELREEVEHAVTAHLPTFAAADAERFYQYLGAWKGPLATREAQQEARAFWRSSGATGVRWLVQRLRTEHHIDALHGVASLLSDLGDMILGPIFEELVKEPSSDQSLALLWALGSLSESEASPRLEGVQAELVLVDLLQNDAPDIREAAATAMRLLPAQRASRWLSHRLRIEAGPDVRKTIEGELERAGPAKV